ncbi:mitochondrial dna helicase [Diplodia corticola]|uniref:ATP-dependent DNA helicase PIF1 n=1 Tax=Diplodia corticola TaxID=236234 RepID=A0A1J9S2U9_9PEZI|nr:mitochondrial dna helicase [Diplodia corticola]OJD34332.1 mitochondrial dna helicase [Diplodia corticola]
MFKKAVDTHHASSRPAKPALSQQLFPGATPAQQTAKLSQATIKPNDSRPLAATTGNTSRTSTTTHTSGGSRPVHNGAGGLKPTSGGLIKALDPQRAFGDEDLPKTGSQHNPYIIDDTTTAKKSTAPAMDAVYFDENDFDDDIDLDVEDPSTKSTVTYPAPVSNNAAPPKPASLPKPQPLPHANDYKPRFQGLDRFQRSDSGYHSQSIQVKNHVEAEPGPDATQEIPWSSSPIEHTQAQPQATALKRFLYSGPEDPEDRPKPAKKRTLPWPEEEKKHGESIATNESSRPQPKDSKLLWNTSLTAMKQMQKNHRERDVNKKMTKTSSTGASGLIADSIRTKKGKLSRVFLSEEQTHVLNLVVNEGKSVFFTGSAGTGKSVLLREIIAALKKKYIRESERVAVTASTGLAACNIGGVTLHSFSGIGLGNAPVEELVKKIKRNQKHKHRWMRVKVLIVDEVSMIDGDLFDKLEAIARNLRNNGRPFGGIQVIITGDFFQLPPVPEKNKVAKFAFDANTWNTVIEHTIGLTHIFRQKDPVFAGMLNEMREGRLSPSSIEAFKQLNRPLESESGLEATELFPLRQQVEEANRRRMTVLHGDVRTYEAKDGGTIQDKTQRDRILANCMAPEAIQLKKGAQVMLIKNMDETLVNGSLGRVIGFMNEAMFDSYQQNEEQYLGISSANNPDDPEERMLLEQRRRAKITDMLNASSQLYPVVRFTLPDGTMRDLLCQRESWKNELPNGEVVASRSQVPLILAWALSIHKAQGQTLERVKVDLGRVFEKGQAYVALSRATNMAGLQVMNFDPKKVNAHERVRSFYTSLSNVQAMAETKKKSKKRGVTGGEYERSVVEDDWADDGGEYAYGS